jgi:esterase/lipase superfamily enzyme
MLICMLPFIIAVGGCTTADLVNEPQKSTKTVEPAVSTNVLYLTDRAPAETKAHTQTYGATRSRFISFGNVTLRAPPSTSKKAPDLQVTSVVETGRFPKAPYEIELTPKGARRSPAAVNAYETAKHAFQSEIAARLARSPRKEVVVFIHGYNNTFEDALKATGNICDTLKNEFVCIALTWPAGGSGGLAMGYNIDRESGEFAAADIRRAIRVISETPGLQRLHLMAHSRGTDVLASSLQQLGIEAYATKSSLGERYKIGNLIFFAPDIDLDVAETKMFGIVSDPDAAFGGGANPLGYFPPQGFIHRRTTKPSAPQRFCSAAPSGSANWLRKQIRPMRKMCRVPGKLSKPRELRTL